MAHVALVNLATPMRGRQDSPEAEWKIAPRGPIGTAPSIDEGCCCGATPMRRHAFFDKISTHCDTFVDAGRRTSPAHAAFKAGCVIKLSLATSSG